MKFESRETIGLKEPVSRPRIPGPVYKTTIHYNGPETGLSLSDSHYVCRQFWRGVQNYHMDVRGWHDIAYSGGACPHGVKMAGRGAGVRTAANGTTNGNDHYYAIFLFVGGDEEPTPQMLAAAKEFAADLGVPELNKHSDHKSTACPGPYGTRWVDQGAPVTWQEEEMQVTELTEQALDQIRNHIFGATYVTDEYGERIRHNTVLARVYKRTALIAARTSMTEVDEEALADALLAELAPLGEEVATRVVDKLSQRLME